MGSRIMVARILVSILAWMVVLMFVASVTSPNSSDIPFGPGSILATLFVHFIMFGVLGALVAYHVYRAKTGHPALLGVTLASLVGILAGIATEMYQLQVPARETSFLDLVSDTVGATSGGIIMVWFKLNHKREIADQG